MSYIPEYHENYYRVEGTAYNQGKIGIGTINPVQLLHVSGGNIRVDGTGYVNGDLNVTGNLNVYGTAAQFAVQQIYAEDKNIEINVQTGVPIGGSGLYTTSAISDDAGAVDGGITLKSTSIDTARKVQDKLIYYRNNEPESGWVSNLRWVVSGNYGKNTLTLVDPQDATNNRNIGLSISGSNTTDAVNLYRISGNALATDDLFAITVDSGKNTLHLNSTNSNVGMTIGHDTVLYRSGTNVLATDDRFGITLDDGKKTLHLSNDTVNVGLTIGNNTDRVELYRVSGNVLATDDVILSTIASGKNTISLTDTSTNVGLTLGHDTNLYRSGANTLSSDDLIATTYNGGKNTLHLNNTAANVGMTIGHDTVLYRSGVDTLRTDDNLGVVLNFNVDGNTILGDATSDTVTFNARANSNLEPSSNNAVNLGSSALNWGTAFLNTLQVAANSTLTGNLNVNGNTTLGDATSDTVTFTARSASDITPSTNNSVNLGSSALNWGTGFLNNLRVKSDAIVTGYFSGLGSGTFSDGSGFITTTLLNNPLSVVGSGNNYMQLNIQNRATGTDASADLVITANNGTDNTNFINLGINNSGYNNAGFTNGTGYDGYLFIDGGDLDIGTRTAGKAIEFHAGGTTQDKTIVRISESGLNLVSGNLNLLSGNYIRFSNSPVILTSGATGEALLHIRANSTRPILSQSEYSGVNFAYQPSFIDKNSIVHLYARNGSTTTDNFGFGNLNPLGTVTAKNVTGSSFYAATKRIGYTTTSLSTAVGIREDGSPQWMRGGSGFGGFYFKSRFGIGEMDAAISGKTRGFIGLTSLSGANILTSNPSARQVDILGVGFDSGDNTWSFMHNSGATVTATKIPLANYDCINRSGSIIEFSMYAIPSSGVGFHVNIANSGNTYATGYYTTTNLPALGVTMTPVLSLYHTNTTSVSGIGLDINGLYIESYK
jgi:hypothetical protein